MKRTAAENTPLPTAECNCAGRADYKPTFGRKRFLKMSPGSESWRRTYPAVSRKLSIPHPCDVDDQRALRECAVLLGPLSSASPDSNHRFLRAFLVVQANRAGQRGTATCRCSEHRKVC